MAKIRAYHRPDTLEEALALLAHTDVDATILAGGTVVNTIADPIEVVDLQSVGLDAIVAAGERVEIGAMVRLGELTSNEMIPAPLRDLARREAPSTFRNVATVGGTVATADFESELLAGLLVFEATVTVVHAIGSETMALGDLFADRSRLGLGIITTVAIATGGDAAAERTGRTPADRPIVAAVARRGDDGAVRLALTGVDATPVLVDPAATEELDPPGDFRGSSAYRRELARVLTHRVMARLGEAR